VTQKQTQVAWTLGAAAEHGQRAAAAASAPAATTGSLETLQVEKCHVAISFRVVELCALILGSRDRAEVVDEVTSRP
jgi:hypothetical protein